MPTNKTSHENDTDRNSLALPTLTTRFEEAPVTAVLWRGRWCWRGAEVGRAIGYEQGRILVDKVRGAEVGRGVPRGQGLRRPARGGFAAVSGPPE
jgi:hypothetical protein